MQAITATAVRSFTHLKYPVSTPLRDHLYVTVDCHLIGRFEKEATAPGLGPLYYRYRWACHHLWPDTKSIVGCWGEEVPRY